MKDPATPPTAARRRTSCAPSAPSRRRRTRRACAQAIGETDFEPQQILGYAPVEPDGSFKLLVPADMPLGLAILDAKGRAIQTHLNWIQVRPGERRTCDGCHSPRRGASLNSGAIVNSVPAALDAGDGRRAPVGRDDGVDAHAARCHRAEPAAPISSTPTTGPTRRKPGVTARPSITVRYTGNADAADDLATAVPTNGIINYPDHIQPLWTRSRGTDGVDTCTNCHSDTAKLDLRATRRRHRAAGVVRGTAGRRPGDRPATGQPVTRLEDGVPVIVRNAPLVENMAGNALGMTRASRLGEIMFGETLKASAGRAHRAPEPAGQRARPLDAAERSRRSA